MALAAYPCQHGNVHELAAPGPEDHLEPWGAGQLSPAERAAKRRNRRLLTYVLVPSLLVGTAALLAALIASRTGPSIRPLDVPAGYQAVSDGYFAYAVPSNWSQSQAYTDDVGDLDTQGTAGWVAEHVDARANPPVAGETPPTAFATFGEPRPTPYQIGAGSPVRVVGATSAYRYLVTRPGGFQATAIDAWQAKTSAEVWILIQADSNTTDTVLASLRG
jgi:hypothetical protein